jgi:exonuclease SbcD
MRILHTADWHIGKRLGIIDRRPEFEQVLGEVVAIAKDQKVDLAIVAGDLLDRAMPTFESMQLAIDTLVQLADAAGEVVVIAGNHDSADLLAILGPLLAGRGITVVPRVVRPADGGVVKVAGCNIPALPFLHQAQVVDFMSETAEWFKGYADKIRLLCKALVADCDPGDVTILTGHFFIDGAELGGGERAIHLGREYAATTQAIPPGVHYAALGHVHKPQAIKGAAAPSRYAGSLLQLDFSERSHEKEVVIVDAAPGRPAKVTPIQLESGRTLIRVEDTLESLGGRAAEFGDAYLDVRVQTSGPVFGLADQVRDFLPNAVIVQAVYERMSPADVVAGEAERPLHEAYATFYARDHGVEPPAEIIEAFRFLEREVERAAS